MIKVEKLATLIGHRDAIYALEQSHSEMSHIFFAASGDGMVAQWDLSRPEIGDLIAKVDNSVYAICYREQKHQLIIGQNFEGIHLIDLEEKKELNSLKLTDAAIFDIKIHQNNAFIACGDGVLIVVDLESWQVKKHIKASEKSIRTIAIDEEKALLALGFSDHYIRIFTLDDFQPIKAIPAHENSVFALQFDFTRGKLLSSSRDAHLKIWNPEDNFQLSEDIIAHMYAVNHIAISPSGKYWATCSMDKSIKIWDAQSHQLLKVIDKGRHAGHGTSVNKLLWSSYQGQLISASDDRTISVWDLKFPL